MKSVRNTLLLIAAMLFSLPTMAIEMSKEEARDYVKAFVDRQKADFGKSNEMLHLIFANVEFEENTIKYYFNRELDEFTPLMPELTQGKFKTNAQEHRYITRQFALYFLSREVHNDPKFLEAREASEYQWDALVMNPRQNVPFYTYTFNYQDIKNSIDLNNGDVTCDFKNFVSISLVDRALKSLMEQVYIQHDSVGISHAHLTDNMLNCTMLTTSDAFEKITATKGMVARNEWIESFLEDCMAKNYYKQLLAVIKIKQPSVRIRVEDIHKKFEPQVFYISTFDILAAAEQSATGGLSAVDYIVKEIGGPKQKDEDHGLFMVKYGDVARQVKQVLETGVDKSKRVYEVVDEMPEFPGGTLALSNYLYNNVKYPPLAAQNRIQGRVTCQFVITYEGKVTNVEISQSSDPLLDAEAKRVITSMPKWIPGRHHGERVNTKYSVPVTFSLPN
jgi:TonB family protein